MPEGLYLLNPPTKRRHARKPRVKALHKRKGSSMTNKKRRYRRRKHNPVVNPHVRGHYRRKAKRSRARKRNPSAAVLYGLANPKKRKYAKKRRSGGGRGGFLSGFGDLGKLLQPSFLMQAAGAGAGLIAAVLVPNWLFNAYPWYQGWVKQGVRAATGLLAFPLITRMLPPAVQTGFASGVVAAVGVGGIAEMLGRPLIVGPGASDVAATPNTLFAGLGAPIERMIRSPFGAPVEKMIANPFAGFASDLGMAAIEGGGGLWGARRRKYRHPGANIIPVDQDIYEIPIGHRGGTGRDLVSMLYDRNSAVGF